MSGSETRKEVGGAGMVLGGWEMVRGKGWVEDDGATDDDAAPPAFDATG